MKKLIISTVLLTAISVSHASDVARDDLGAAMRAQSQVHAQTTKSISSTTMMKSGFDHEDLAEKAPIGTMSYYVRMNENKGENSQETERPSLKIAPCAIGY